MSEGGYEEDCLLGRGIITLVDRPTDRRFRDAYCPRHHELVMAGSQPSLQNLLEIRIFSYENDYYMTGRF